MPEFEVPGEEVPLSVVIPCHNEGSRIQSTIEAVVRHLGRIGLKDAEIIVVDDGSTDQTAAVAAARPVPGLRVLRSAVNEGKGAAVRKGILAARGRFVLMADADLSTPVSELDALMASLEAGVDIAIASRHLPGASILLHQGWRRRLAGRVFRAVVRAFLLPGLSDTQCGFKLFRRCSVRGIFENLQTKGFAFDVEFLRRARSHGLRIVEVPVAWRHAEPSSVTITGAWDMVISLIYIGRAT